MRISTESLALKIEERFNNKILDPIHELTEIDDNYFVFNYQNYYDTGEYNEVLSKEAKTLESIIESIASEWQHNINFAFIGDMAIKLKAVN